MVQARSAEEQKADSERRAREQNEWETRTAALPPEEESLTGYFAACTAALEDERQRQQSIDARLTTLVGLSSIAGTVVFGAMLTNVPRTLSALFWLILIALGYLIMQLASAILAAIRGLERRAYETMHSAELLPSGREASTYHCRRRIREFWAILVQHQDQNNAKMTHMAVAHCAMKNFIGGLVIFAILASFHHIVEQPSNDLVDRLKTDHVLREMLRGPQGPTGSAGPAGPAGAIGPMGPQVAPAPAP